MSLHGTTICFTGTPLQMKLDDASREAINAGAKVSGTVTETTNILVCGSGVGAKKLDDAEKKGVVVWTKEEFTSALSGGGGGGSISKKQGAAASCDGCQKIPRPRSKSTRLLRSAPAPPRRWRRRLEQQQQEERQEALRHHLPRRRRRPRRLARSTLSTPGCAAGSKGRLLRYVRSSA